MPTNKGSLDCVKYNMIPENIYRVKQACITDCPVTIWYG